MQQYFNPRSPHGERRRCEAIPPICSAFQSTLPAWGATPRSKFIARIRIISIHAPRMGSDLQAKCDSAEADVFQSTPPRMGSDNHSCQRQLIIFIFQSTPPAWGATEQKNGRNYTSNISIHAPAWGATNRNY